VCSVPQGASQVQQHKPHPLSGYTRSANLCCEANPFELDFQPTSHPVKSPWGFEPVLQIILACIVFTRDIKNQFIREGLMAPSGGTQWRAFARHAKTMICDALT
jgi:hypothetical protein